MSDFDSLTKIYDALVAHYKGEKVLHPAHLQAYLDAMTRMERRVDALADMYGRLLRNATWLDPQGPGETHPRKGNPCPATTTLKPSPGSPTPATNTS